MEINREMLLQSFREETEECLQQMEQLLLALETRPEDRELVSSLFRAAHTIKGNASLLSSMRWHDSCTMSRICWISAAATSWLCRRK